MDDVFAIPCKRALQISLKDALTAVIDNTFYQTATSVENDLTLLDKYRDVLFHFDVCEADLNKLKQYYMALRAIAVKLPDDQVEFTWFNTLGLKSSGMTRNSLCFEINNVLYNIGAMYSSLAVEQNLGTAEGLKESFSLFKLAAGCFQYIYDKEIDNLFKFFDEYTLSALISMMLAQAQQMVWKKAYFDDKERHSILSRLALQVALFYQTASKNANSSPYIRTDWVKSLTSKSQYFMAVAYYRSALQQLKKQNYAQSVCDLQHTLTWIKKLSLDDELIEWRKEIQLLLSTTERDNDLIYLQPSVNTPSVIKPAIMAQADLFDDIEKKDSVIFKNLLPIDVLESCNAFNERVNSFVEEHIKNPLEAMNKILLEALPQSLDCNSYYISEQEWISYTASLEDLEQLRTHVQNELHAAKSMLRKDINENEQMLREHGLLRWNIPSKDETTESLLADLDKINDYIQNGQKVDADTVALFKTLDHDLVTNTRKPPESNHPLSREISSVLKERKDHILRAERKIIENRILPKIVSFDIPLVF
ncbi:unnamed protein product [Kluyveromyces dobzhanskii CBS 2104]|uniref:WGS project CCBQ000000000 data, contig 00099 n=1 Tax=Kluyveromyces dobzhanskii CBS 2104 TaxID=1427455 RepID=A0A0A8L477_9SACH|nr:unnamed protein product [Kluyveromyces dobzhanskii CBS 2104]